MKLMDSKDAQEARTDRGFSIGIEMLPTIPDNRFQRNQNCKLRYVRIQNSITV
jgi:hypothetical protein